jgi:hypothetical protein
LPQNEVSMALNCALCKENHEIKTNYVDMFRQ